jgi:hypothetical protein
MRLTIAIGLVAFLFTSLSVLAQNRPRACLPDDVKPDEPVTTQTVKLSSGGEAVKEVTVEEKLIEMKARCKKGKLVDPAGKEIRFYRLTGCWGNPPADYEEILARQQRELEEMKKHYRVVEIECPALRHIQ